LSISSEVPWLEFCGTADRQAFHAGGKSHRETGRQGSRPKPSAATISVALGRIEMMARRIRHSINTTWRAAAFPDQRLPIAAAAHQTHHSRKRGRVIQASWATIEGRNVSNSEEK